ncbi:MAG: DUF2282 domain-containing protein [Alphaproteobacteria bacterium]
MVSKKTVNTLLVSAVALTVAGSAGVAHAMEGKEKCYGVVKAGANDCANASKSHSCAGHATADADGGEWLALPSGVCEKLAGGSLEPVDADVEAEAVDTEAEAADDAAHGEAH